MKIMDPMIALIIGFIISMPSFAFNPARGWWGEKRCEKRQHCKKMQHTKQLNFLASIGQFKAENVFFIGLRCGI
jgi:hypothetical protein